MGVGVDFFQPGLMHMLMRVFGPVGVRMGVFVLEVVVLVCGVCVGVGHLAVLVLVRVWRIVGVLVGHRCHLLA